MPRPALVLAVVCAPWWGGSMVRAQSDPDDTRYSVGIEVFGRAPYPIPSRGARLGFTSGGIETELAYLDASKTVLMTEVDVKEYELRLNSWLSSSVYAGLGLGLRDVHVTYDSFLNDAAVSETHVTEHRQTVIGGAHVGFEYALGWLAIGADLVGLSVPLFNKETGERYPNDAADFEEDPKEYPYVKSAVGTSYHLLRAYVKVRI